MICLVHTANFAFACDGSYLVYAPVGQAGQSLYPGDYSTKVVNGTLAYNPRSQLGGTAGGFYFNLEALPSFSCTLFHREDDGVTDGLVIATDIGNGYVDLWGRTVPTFILSKVGVPAGRILNNCAEYQIYCLSP